ncbi:MAG: bifunctional 3-(3-hydroxy-phenyl)propionate/3-hydroxycinnamic acid hydroxylase [Phenylobacterium sp.]|nr:bifunctional 3-(3-hydroxy-phenyl)propionate/3-hydroxycinnamic acid hydroxylase [Phenylobacterium sp.]MCA6232713.1 bifunctional 3-(3-hydroxy-phenyl)propionate/3-hydroxycinnamic acid hydroxylase [Phenylobacterium sp.]MCA6233534.1 bifunctional 3-(3-hydroxy-phenyl)propionate/3-hydroxycinnamic acid hydroxylase [Phenylobacterium sp.]MCA6248427.1 bifunctional 3-(3-hydroxy-phenyl)propionate/3-hydroxycinnamic acid hydroxylase [Phenylobacterium sp.]MCA6252830.1 bifunctional 3-(3-hydroxy-phenyl)propion
MALGLLLGKEGVRTVIAEREADIYPLPRGAHIDDEIIRLLQGLGVADAVAATSRTSSRYDFLTAKGEVLMSFPSNTGRTRMGWPSGLMIHQPSMEAHLRGQLASAESVELRSQWTLIALAETPGGVLADFETPEGPRRLLAKWVVGCDGARSTIRSLGGFALDDLDFDEPWLVVDVLVDDASRLPGVNLQICDPARPTTCALMGEGRHRWEFMLRPGETAEQAQDPAFVADLLKPWKVEGAVRIERTAVYRFHALVARRWRQGRLLLAGDAAHQMPPFAGQGLCSGLRDAANLAWKLGRVVRGQSPDALLDTYQPEREPNVRAIIGMALMMGRTVCILDPQAAEERDRRMLADRAAGNVPAGPAGYPPITEGCILPGTPAAGWPFTQPVLDDGRRMDDALPHGAWLFRTPGPPPAGLPDDLIDLPLDSPRLAGFEPAVASLLAGEGVSAALVRPDRYVFGSGEAQDLVRAWAGALAAERT